MRNNVLLQRILLLITGVFSMLCSLHAQPQKRLSLEISPLYSYMDVRYGQYAVRNNPGIEDPQGGLGGAVNYEVELNHLFSVSAGLSYERRHHAYTSVFDPYPHPNRETPYQFTYDDSYDFIGIPLAWHINYLNLPTLRVYHSLGTQFGSWVQSDRQSVWYYINKDAEFHHYTDTKDKTDVVVSLTSSIGICKNITRKVAFKLEPGFSYMANNFFENDHWAGMRYFDLRMNMGLVFHLNSPQDK